MEVVVVLALSVALMLNAVVLTWIGMKIRRLAVGLGYRGPTVVILIGVVGVVAFAMGLAGVTAAVDEHWPVAGVAAMFLLPNVLMVECAGLVALLPRRSLREGVRTSSFPFRGLRRLAEVGSVLTVLGGLAFGIATGAWSIVRIGITLAMVAAVCAAFARRQQLARADSTADNDARPPVVYLRSFRRDTEIFSEEAGRANWSGLRRRAGVFYGRADEVYLSFERFVEGAVDRHIGPFRALGNPADYLPPEGATRTYLGEDWETEVRGLIDQAGCILTVVAAVCDSRALIFEFTYMLRHHAADRLFVATNPYGPTRRPPLGMRIGNRLQATTPTPWERFARDLNILGYQVPVDPPAPGTVLGFDVHGRAVEVTRGARTPDDYILPIAERLAEGHAHASPHRRHG